ncbi:DUF3108 domain-containing protein [Undibacterium sp. TS12]|uniref:DUF3108 domain-containing protein n=1 Tax=Undibacterium sp. TS12 TaxID=2908202 RepID=UPI001F4C9264|nr:DUF3108 domain-containing protein [Undibacterium sp. TS12]MCH8621243.1 DUF3108 domain-containing protein [Undibacterium sp. TS12]
MRKPDIIFISLILTGSLFHMAAAQASEANPRHATRLPPPAELQYSIKAKQSGIPLSGSASVKWQHADQKYSIITETRAMLLGKILDASSQGSIDDYGLAPDKFIEKRFNKPATTSSFDRDSKTLRFTASTETYPLKGGEQDRTSATWQLIALARAAGDNFKAGTEWKMLVAGRRDADPWTFKVLGAENVKTPLGDMPAVHVSKAPPADSKDQQLDLWLAPGLEWYPVRLKFADADGDFVDQVLESIKK